MNSVELKATELDRGHIGWYNRKIYERRRAMISGAEIMVKCLQEEGVEIVFGYPGAVICPFFDYLYRGKRICKSSLKSRCVRRNLRSRRS